MDLELVENLLLRDDDAEVLEEEPGYAVDVFFGRSPALDGVEHRGGD